MKKIGIDARMYGAELNRGIGRYIEKLLDYLVQLDCDNEYFIFLRRNNFDLFNPPVENFTKVLLDIPWYSVAEQVKLPLLLRQYNLDLMHFPHFNAPIFYAGKYIVTIHDLIMTHFPSSRATTGNVFVYKQKVKIARWLVKQAARSAQAIITPTFYIKNEVASKLSVPSDKIIPIYEGVDKLSEQASDLSNWPITKPFFLYVGSAYPHKNLEMLIQAFQKFNRKKNFQLVLVGRFDFFYQRLMDVIGNDSDIIIRPASNAELVSLYRRAELFVFPSLAEGFGLPPLEAMSQGCPVVASRASCLPEVLGKAALYFDPLSCDSLIISWQKIIEDKSLRDKLVRLGYARAEQFQWDKMAKQTLSLYQQLLP